MKSQNVLLAVAAGLAVLLVAPVGWSMDYAAPQPQPAGTAACNTDQSCFSGDCCEPCCGPCLQLYGEFLYLRPRNAGVEYAVPANGPVAAGAVPLQAGRTAALNPQFEPGFRLGGAVEFDNWSSIGASFTYYENTVNDAITTTAPIVLYSMVMHPSSADAAKTWLDASARGYMRYELADIDYRHMFYCNERSTLDYVVGIRYANLVQDFRSRFDSIITDTVDTQVNFDGAGIRLGLEGERVGCHDFFLYGKGSVSFLGGEFRGNYLQSSTTTPVIAQTDWKEDRLVSILDCEVGLGWTGCNGHVRASAGYMVSGWLNVVKTSEFISSVQANKYHGPDKIDGNGLDFDGLVARLELRR
jgi:hypothetical protein